MGYRLRWRSRLTVLIMASGLSACSTLHTYTAADGTTGQYAEPIGTATVTTRHTPYSAALECLGTYLRHGPARPARIAVGRISDFTGKQELEGGFKLTQGASLMAMSALAKAGITLVERFDTAVTELELRFANNKLVGDGEDGYRRIMAGTVEGSDFYLVGGITELNFNIRSNGLDGFGGSSKSTGAKGFVRANAYVMDISLDLRLVDTKSLQVVDLVSYQKQIVGREVSAGVFDFFGSALFDISAGTGALEPIQYAVRSVIERAVLELIGRLYAVGPDLCARSIKTEGLTLADASAAATADRADPNRWHEDRDLAPRRRAVTGAPAKVLAVNGTLDDTGEGSALRITLKTTRPVHFKTARNGLDLTLFGLRTPMRRMAVKDGGKRATVLLVPHGTDPTTARLTVMGRQAMALKVVDVHQEDARREGGTDRPWTLVLEARPEP